MLGEKYRQSSKKSRGKVEKKSRGKRRNMKEMKISDDLIIIVLYYVLSSLR